MNKFRKGDRALFHGVPVEVWSVLEGGERYMIELIDSSIIWAWERELEKS